MKSIIDLDKRKVLVIARATAKRSNIALPTKDNIVEDEGVYYIDLNISDSEQLNLPIGLEKNVCDADNKDDILAELKKELKAIENFNLSESEKNTVTKVKSVKKKTKRTRKFVIKTASNDEPYFSLVASNGQVLMTSETYSTKQQMQNTLNTLIGKQMPTKVINELE